MKKVIVIGLDGLEPKIAKALLDAGELPNLAQLRQQGGFSIVRTTYPPQTPVAWSTFQTGTNPGGHGIYDFLRRDPETYLPALSLTRYEQKNRFLPPQVVNLRRGIPMWQLLTEAGVHSTILRCPCTYPPDKIQGQMLSGVGVPDLRGGLGTSTFYSSGDGFHAEENEKIIHIQTNGANPVSTHLIGPRNPKTGDDLQVDITLHLEPVKKQIVLTSEGQPKTLEIREGQWSDWLKVKFKAGMLQSVSGQVRFFLTQLTPVLELYASPINFDPDAPLFPISHPAEYASELAARLGTFYTTGMAEDHDGLNHERFDETAYLQQCEVVLRERAKMMRYELERFKQGLFFCLFDTPDRLQHMFWRFRENNHPANHNGDANGQMRHVIEDHYRTCDRIVGQALQYADEDTLVIVLSDHGMNSFQRGIHLNTWLHDNGFLALNTGVKPGEEAGEFFHNVDWSNTKAYALGLGGIYLNMKGREGKGIVRTEDVEAIKTDIARGLTDLRDPERGEVAVRGVVAREAIYSGPFVSEAPDLLVNFAPGYRVSWGTPLGGTPEGLFEDNTKKWGGDHMIDPNLAPGVLFMNRPFQGENASLLDLAPTILATLGVPKGAAMEGSSLL
jgi:predicted AlkP superfamily phosphohydrolase/phosphomutase